MYCIQVDIPHALCQIDDELKAIYHSKDGVCIWVFGSREDRNNFIDETAGMLKAERESYYHCLLYTSPSPRDYAASRMPSSA